METEVGMERNLRHMSVAHRSDFEFLQQSLREAASRFRDLADIIEKDRAYDPVPFLRASAERFDKVANLED